MLKQRLGEDLKAALLAGDKNRAMTIRSIKSVILYAEVAGGSRTDGLGDDEIIALLAKEAKKRQESADLYIKGGSEDRAAKELGEKKIIEEYLPKQLTDEELTAIIDAIIDTVEVSGARAMGQVISLAKQRTAGQAEGSRIARMVQERLQ